jgi:hypothetical protein
MPRQRVYRTAAVRVELDSLDAAPEQKLGDLLRLVVLALCVDGPAVHGVIDE